MARTFTPQELGLVPLVEQEKKKNVFTPAELGLTPVQEPEQQAKKSVFTADELGLVAPKEETALPSAQEPFHKVDLKQLGIETDPDQQIINTLIGSKAAASGAANDKARQLAEERLAFAKDQAQRAMRTGASADDAAEIFASSLTPVSTVEKSNINLPSNAKEIAKNTFMRAIKSGVAGYQSMGALGADLLSDEDTARSLLGKAQESREAAAEYPAAVPTIQQARNPKETLTFLLEGMGENLPTLVESIFGAGAGRILAERGAASLVKGLSDDAALKLTEKLAKYGTIAGAGATSIAQESGSIYQDIYDETGQMRPGVATAFGTLAGALDSILPATVVNTAFRKQMIEDLGKSIIERYGVNALKSISEESATEFLQTFIEKGGVSYVDGRPVFTKENFNEALNAAAIGAGLGGGTSLISQGISDAQLKAQGITREQAKAYLESEQVSEEAKQAALNKWKTSGLTQGLQRPEAAPDVLGRVEPTISTLPEIAEAAAPQVEPLQPAYEGEEIPAELASNPEFVGRVKQYEGLGYTRENAILVAKQDLADMEVQNGTPTVPGTDREGIEVPGGPTPSEPTGGVVEPIGAGVVGSGESTGTIEEGTLSQPTALEEVKPNYADMSYEELDKLANDASTINQNLDIEAVRKHFGEEEAAKFASMNKRQQDKWWDNNATEELERDSSAFKGINDDEIADFRKAVNDFDIESAWDLGKSIAVRAKDFTKPDFVGSPAYTSVRNALKYAQENGMDMNEVREGMIARAEEWGGNNAYELFKDLFKQATQQPRTAIEEAPVQIAAPQVTERERKAAERLRQQQEEAAAERAAAQEEVKALAAPIYAGVAPEEELPTEEDPEAKFNVAKDTFGAFVRQKIGPTESIAPEDVVSPQQALSALADIMEYLIKNGATSFAKAAAQARQRLGANAKGLTNTQLKEAYAAAKAKIASETPKQPKGKREKADEILAKIDISEYPERMGTALGRLIKARSFEEAKKPLRAIFHAGDLKLITATLPTMTTMQITDLVGEDIPHLPQVNKLVQKMSVMRTRMLAALAETAEPWEKFQRNNPEGSRILARLMNYATLAEIDPTLHSDVNEALRKDIEINELREAMQNATNPRARANFLGQINKRERRIRTAYTMWNKLGNYQNGKGKEIFNRVRDHYKAQFNLHRALLEDRIASANVPGDVKDASTPKGKLMAAIRLTYARAKEVGVYFPLMRYGNFWVRVGTGKNKEFYMFQSETDRNLFVEDRVEQLRRAGDSRGRDEMMQDGDLDYGNDMTKLRRDVEESSEMLKQIFSIIDTQGTANKEELKDAVYQMFLTTLPDRDFRKQFTHRQGTAGFSSDALRNFARSGYSSASQMARLKFGPAITDEMDAAHAALQGNPNKPKLEIYLNEIGRRVGEEVAPLNPDNSMLESLSTIGNQAAFFWLLTSGASALTNITAIPIFGYPVLGSNYGYGRTSVVLGKYMALYNHMTIRSEDEEGKHWIAPSVGESKHVKTNPILAAAYDVAHNELNITDVTRTFDMLSMARMPSTSYQNKFQRGTRFVVRASGALFHHSERMIREIMFMGGFELAYEKALKDGLAGGINGEAFTRAIKEAEKYTYQSMFNYQKYDRPSIMRGPLKKMAFQFALYKQQVIAFYVRNFYTMINGSDLDPEARNIATKQFVGAMLMTGLFGGITGLFGFNAIMNVVQGLLDAMHDDDEPTYIEDRDLNLWFKTKFLPEHFGDNSKFADIMGQNEWNVMLEKGPIAALSNVDIASRISQADIWFRDNQYDASSDAQFSEFILSQLGPAVGLVRSAPRIYDDFRSGHFNEGVNKMLPAFAKGLQAQYVWGEEGVMTKNKRTYVLTPDEVTPSMRFWKFVGFNPTELSRIQDANYRVGTLINKAEDRRAQILDRLFLEFDRGDEKGFSKALEEVEKFNLDNPGKHLRIKPSTYLDSIKSKEKIKVMADHGLVVPKGMEYEIYSLVYPTRPKDKE